jgi:diguanylate cyclase (GGDEF)-like protein
VNAVLHATEPTFVVDGKSDASKVVQDALLVHIYPVGPMMGSRHRLGQSPLVIGRGEDSDICVDEHTVSRRHARVALTDAGYVVTDLGSTNGTFLNNDRTTQGRLTDGDYLRAGNCIFRFLAGGNVEAEYHEEIYRLTIIDALTELHTKRFFLEFLDRELTRSERRGPPLTLLLFDVDHFKRVNDSQGHLAGDFILRELAARVKDAVRKEELFARYGGEEFAIVLPDTTLDEGRVIAERVRSLVAERPFLANGEEHAISVSVGVATAPGYESIAPQALIRDADSKLYAAKGAGRNCVRS